MCYDNEKNRIILMKDEILEIIGAIHTAIIVCAVGQSIHQLPF